METEDLVDLAETEDLAVMGGNGGDLDNSGLQAVQGRQSMGLRQITGGPDYADVTFKISDPFGYYGVINLIYL